MIIGDSEFTVEEIIEATVREENKADYEALRENELFKTEPQYTREGLDKLFKQEDGKKYLQPHLDRASTKGIQSHIEKNKDKYVSIEEVDRLLEAEKNKISEYDNKFKKITIESKIKDMLLKQGVKAERVSSALKLADLSTVSLEDNGNLLGANDVVNSIKEEYKEWFGASTTGANNGAGANANGGKAPGTTGFSEDELNQMSDAEYYAAQKKE